MNIPRFHRVLCQKRFQMVLNALNPNGCITRHPALPSALDVVNSNCRLISTVEVKTPQKDESLVKRILRKVPFINVDYVKIKGSGYLLYETIADGLDYIDIMEKHELPDTFYSWFVITELHIWMLSARAMAEGKEGQLLRNSLVEALWTDVAKRTKKLGEANPAATRAQIQELSEQLQAAFIAYDEGLQSDDVVLAGAIWRRMYQRSYASPHDIESFVRHVRKHMSMLDSLSKEQIIRVEPVKWEPI